MAIHFHCPNGHRLRTSSERAGGVGTCPRCRARTVVPRPQSPLTDSAILRVLDEPAASERPGGGEAGRRPRDAVEPSELAAKFCPCCRRDVSLASSTCPQCRTYLGRGVSVWQRALEALRAAGGATA